MFTFLVTSRVSRPYLIFGILGLLVGSVNSNSIIISLSCSSTSVVNISCTISGASGSCGSWFSDCVLSSSCIMLETSSTRISVSIVVATSVSMLVDSLFASCLHVLRMISGVLVFSARICDATFCFVMSFQGGYRNLNDSQTLFWYAVRSVSPLVSE
uniref:Uncharacterized protein n=1 Tax=Cacopsylla melanoneura TaxID=428564 RepID=A0A8D8TQ32_9HEMI